MNDNIAKVKPNLAKVGALLCIVIPQPNVQCGLLNRTKKALIMLFSLLGTYA